MFDKLEKRLKSGILPGGKAHQTLKATPIGNNIPKFEHSAAPRLGSVLVLLYEEKGQLQFPLIKRPKYVGLHSGQISLPGGKREKGENVIDTALREAHEEIGVPPEWVKVLGTLSDFYVIPSNFLIKPVVSIALKKPIFIPDQHEVERILCGSIDDLLKEDAIKEKDIIAGDHYPMRAPYFEIENEIVWGATAMMLNELRVILKEIL